MIYNLWHLFVQFWKVRLLARRLCDIVVMSDDMGVCEDTLCKD